MTQPRSAGLRFSEFVSIVPLILQDLPRVSTADCSCASPQPKIWGNLIATAPRSASARPVFDLRNSNVSSNCRSLAGLSFCMGHNVLHKGNAYALTTMLCLRGSSLPRSLKFSTFCGHVQVEWHSQSTKGDLAKALNTPGVGVDANTHHRFALCWWKILRGSSRF